MPQTDWERLGELAAGESARAVGVSPEGFALVGTMVERPSGDLLARMKARRARLFRVTATSLTRVWEGPGWVQALDCAGPVAVAVIATLRARGTGSDYHLWVSSDGGRQWRAAGPVGVPSVSRVRTAGEREFWVRGAGSLGHSLDGGATWTELPGGGEPQVGTDGPFTAALVEGQLRVGERREDGVRWGEPLAAGREPVKLVASGAVLRLLSRAADAARGAGPVLHVSEDGGATWSHQPLPPGPGVDLAGEHWGLGVDAGGLLRGRLAPGTAEQI